MRIAILDNQISPIGLQDLSGRIASAYEISDGEVRIQTQNGSLRSHGTVCASILAENLPENVEMLTISVADGSGTIQISNVCIALEWCIKAAVDYLCMSLGTENWLQLDCLCALTKKLASTGTQIYAACSNSGRITLPAAYPWVTGIRYVPEVSGLFREKNLTLGDNIVVGDFSTPALEKLATENGFFDCRTNSMAAPFAMGKMLTKEMLVTELPLYERSSPGDFAKELPVPVVALHGALKSMKELLRMFQDNEFQTALLTDRQESDWGKMVLSVGMTNLGKWAKLFEQAGILLLDAEHDRNSIIPYADFIVDLCNVNVPTAYAQILQFFGTEEEDERNGPDN